MNEIIAASKPQTEQLEVLSPVEILSPQEELTQSIYGVLDIDEVISSFGAMLMLRPANKSEWPKIISDAFSALQMKHRDKGSISSVQKFKALNGRWFGKRKNHTAEIGLPSMVQNVIKRDVVLTLRGCPSKQFVVMTVFSRSYNKWFATKDTPVWESGAKVKSPYWIAVREVELDFVLDTYGLIAIGSDHVSNEVFQIVPMNDITLVVAYL